MKKNVNAPAKLSELKEGAWPVASVDIRSLVGELLTLSDSWSESESVTKARKSLVERTTYRWWSEIQMGRHADDYDSIKWNLSRDYSTGNFH